MKKLIQTHYQEQKVDSIKLMQDLFGNIESSQGVSTQSRAIYWIELTPLISLALLFMAFIYYFVQFNIAFLPTMLTLFFSFGTTVFFLLNIVVGLLAFIVQFFVPLILISGLLILVQIRLFTLK